MPAKTKPTPRALALQQSAARGKPLTDDTDPKATIADGTRDDGRSPPRTSPRKSPRKSPRRGESLIENSQLPAKNKIKRASGPNQAEFAAVELSAAKEDTGLSTENEPHAETTTSITASAETEEEAGLSTKDNEVLENSAVRKTRSQKPKYREESDDDLPMKSKKRKAVQESSSVDTTTTGKKARVDMDETDDDDTGEEDPTGEEDLTGEEDPKDDDDSDDNFFSPVKQQPALAKLSRGRQHKPFSPAGNLTAP
jgi:hypothetical protein